MSSQYLTRVENPPVPPYHGVRFIFLHTGGR